MRRVLVVIAGMMLLLPASALASGDSSIFYYPWWGTKKVDGKFFHWSQYGHAPPTDLATTFYPVRGPYSSSDGDVVRAQMDDIKQAGVSEVITSWWGWGSPEDKRLPLVMHAAEKRGLTVAVQIEPYEKWQRTAEVLNRDLGHLQDAGIRRVYVYRPFDGTIGDDGWSELIASYPEIEFYAQTTDVIRAAADGFLGIYTYDVFNVRGGAFAGLCARAHTAGIACAPSVGPGYNAFRSTGDERIRSRRNGKTYDDMWRAAIAARPDRVTITSYNEWHEGTQIEPAKKHPAELYDPYQSYEGAYGKFGAASERAYIVRTTYWTRAYRLAVDATALLENLAQALHGGR
jgi:glycoprotein endo-alpha-1,2-mannosidase